MAESSLRTTLLGVFFGCSAASLGGMTVALIRFIIQDTDPMSLAALRYGLAALTLAGVMIARSGLPPIQRRDFVALIALSIVMFAGFPFLMARALEDTTAARGAIIFSAVPISTIVIGSIFRVEQLTGYKILGVILGVAGAVIAMGERIDTVAPHALRGDLYMVAAVVCASTFNVFGKRYLVRYGIMPVSVYCMLLGSAVLFGIAMFFEAPFSGSLDFDLLGWFVIFLLSVPGGALMMVSWGRALQLISPTQAAVTVGLNPLVAMTIAYFLLAEPPSARVMIGFLLIFTAIFFANYSPRRRAPAAA